jgi:hypothetical protein
MLDHAVDDHSLNPLNLVRHRNFQLVRQYVRHDADKATWIVPDHALERRATVLLPLGINIGNKGLAELVARPFCQGPDAASFADDGKPPPTDDCVRVAAPDQMLRIPHEYVPIDVDQCAFVRMVEPLKHSGVFL